MHVYILKGREEAVESRSEEENKSIETKMKAS